MHHIFFHAYRSSLLHKNDYAVAYLIAFGLGLICASEFTASAIHNSKHNSNLKCSMITVWSCSV